MNVMLLTAGLGTRLKPYTNTTPKPLIPFLGVPLVEYTLSLLENLPVQNMVCNIHHLPSEVQRYFTLYKPRCKDFYFSDETFQILDTGGGIRNAKKYLDGKNGFILFNGDEVIIPTRPGVIRELISKHNFEKNIATILVTPHPEVGSKFGGVYVNQSEQVITFSKKQVAGLTGLHYTGAIVFSGRIFNYFKNQSGPENILYDTLLNAMEKGERVGVLNEPVKWFETGNSVDFMKATDECLNQLENSSEPWAQYLKQIINYAYPQKPIIELAENPRQWERLKTLFNEKFSGF